MSLIQNIQTITQLYPNHKWTDDELPSILSLLEEEEESILIPILGEQLYEQLTTDNDTLLATLATVPGASTLAEPTVLSLNTPQSITSLLAIEAKADIASALTKANIIKSAIRAVFYRMLANNYGLLSVSFNRGGGMNLLTAEAYDPADSKTKKDFERDAWNKSRRNIESLLMHLEKDARTTKVYTDLWSHSPYFYFHADLLFSTAQEMKPFFPIEDRQQYINLLPTIRVIQNNYIIPRLGSDIVQALLSRKYGNLPNDQTTNTPNDQTTNTPNDQTTNTPNDQTTNTPNNQHLWHSLTTQTLLALGLFVQSRISPRPNTLEDASLALAEAEKLLKANHDFFLPPPPPTEEDQETPAHPHHHRHHPKPCKPKLYDPHACNNAILDLGSLDFNN